MESYKELVERLRKETYWSGSSGPGSRDIHPAICDEAALVIIELLARAEHGTTPVSLTEATRAVLEECADVTVCISALEALGVFSGDELDSVVQEKLERWEKRAQEYEKRVDRTENP